jgi:signal transduction histidine kinase
MLIYEANSLKLASLIGVIYSFLFIIIDHWRFENFDSVLFHRSLMILLLVTLFYILKYIKFKPQVLYNLTLVICIVLFLISFSMDQSGTLPQFFLPNFICLLFFIFNTGIGFTLKTKYVLSFSTLVFYIFYSLKISPHENEHLSQIWNIILNIFISLLIGYLIERYKRLNFIQKKEIKELSAIKTKLISILSHDINSPLNNLNGLLFLNENNELTLEKLHENFGKVRKAIDNVSFLL